MTKSLALMIAFALGTLVVVNAQGALDAKLQGQLKSLFPGATAFSAIHHPTTVVDEPNRGVASISATRKSVLRRLPC